MAYATRSDIEALYGPSHLQTLVAADLDLDTAVAAACSLASADIDTYLSLRYTLPLQIVPETITGWCVDIACWRLAASIAQMSEEVRKRSERVFTILKDVAAGRANVPGLDSALMAGSTGEVSVGSDGGAAFSSRQRRWGGPGGGL